MKFLNKISKASNEIPIELGRFIYKKYPDFVIRTNSMPLKDEVPVFMFHTIEYETFKSQLEYLKQNCYATLNIQEFQGFLNKDIKLQQPSVLLAFDDGDKSWYDVAHPLLKEYRFNAVGFVVPHYIREEPVARNHQKGWLSWPELAEMENAGTIEIESHSYYHARIFISPKLVDFYHPEFPDTLRLDVPWVHDDNNYTNELKLGTPIYEYAPRLSGEARYLDEAEIREACISWVQKQGGSSFFAQPNWRNELTNYFQSARDRFPQKQSQSFETYSQIQEQISKDLVDARYALSERLGKKVQHLCLPWGVGCQKAVSLAREAGYTSCFWVTLNQRRSNHPGHSPYFIPRLKDDYLFRLPGEGRHSLRKIFRKKLQRRRKSLEIY